MCLRSRSGLEIIWVCSVNAAPRVNSVAGVGGSVANVQPDQAIELARARGLNLMQRHPDYSEREWASWKRVWGSLVFLDG